MSEQLLPCPFCGGEAEMTQIGQNKIKIKCTGCYVERTQKILRMSIDWLKTKQAEWWNKRTEPAATEPPKESVTSVFVKYDDENPDYIKGSEDGI